MTRFLRRGAAALLTLCLALPLFGCSGSDTPTESKTPRSDTAVATLCAVGDIRITDELLQAARQGGSYDFSDILRGTTAVVGAADVAIGNLETTLSGEPYNDGSAPDALATALRSTGFSLVQTANSYTIQNGLSGLERTKAILRSAGLTPVGTYESAEDRAQNRAVLVEANGIRIAVVAFTKGMNGMRLPSGAEYCTNLLYTDYDSNYSRIDTDGITAAIDAARAAGESLGGTFRVVATGLLPGVGGYATAGERLTGRIGGALFSIPAIKGVEFGLGFQAARRPGSQVHDPIELDPKAGFTRTRNNAGGLEGGMTTGMPLIVTAAMKPIPTLMTPLATVNLDTLEPEEASRERSDVCAVPACAVVAEAEVAIVLADAYLEKFGHDNMTDIKAAVKSYRQRLRTLSR